MSTNKVSILLNEQVEISTDDFFKTWIPKLYGVFPGESLYKAACIKEIIDLCHNKVSKTTITQRWCWEPNSHRYYVPDYFQAIIILAHRIYLAATALNSLPRKNIHTGWTP